MKRALILSGGAARGAFQAGYLYKNRKKYDLISGVSAGALNGAMIAQGDYDKMRTLWLYEATEPGAVFNSIALRQDGRVNLIGLIWGLIFGFPGMGISSSKPLERLIKKYIHLDKLEIPVLVGATSLNDKKYYATLANSLSRDDLHKLMLASSSFPGVFSPVDSLFNNQLFLKIMSDGGLAGSSLGDAVEWIKKHDKYSYWHIDIVSTYRRRESPEAAPRNILEALTCAIDIIIDGARKRDLKLFLNRNQDDIYKSFSYQIIEPQKALPANWDFTRSAIEISWDQGINYK